MHIRTIDENYEYQMVQATKQLLKDYEIDINTMNGEQLLNFLHLRRKEFGELIVNHMGEWQDENDWLDRVQE